jgi:hypothetical protein
MIFERKEAFLVHKNVFFELKKPITYQVYDLLTQKIGKI